jgi:hypothetical protein
MPRPTGAVQRAREGRIYQQLAAPFPERCIQRTEGRLTGRGDDVSGLGDQRIANRLNEVLGVGGWRAHRTVNVKEIVRSNGRPALEAICDITLELGEWVSGEFMVFAESPDRWWSGGPTSGETWPPPASAPASPW